MHPIIIHPGQQCYDAKGFHCTADLDGHNLHCSECQEYAEQEMKKETITVYRYTRTV